MEQEIPKTQCAIQLVGPDKLELNTQKEVYTPGPHEMIGKIDAVGLCFSDLKLLKQFDACAQKRGYLRHRYFHSGGISQLQTRQQPYCARP